MPLLLVSKVAENQLLGLPESGMGYQVVSASETVYVVFNATLAIELNELRNSEFTEEQYSLLTSEPSESRSRKFKEIGFDEGVRLVFSSLDGDVSSHVNLARNEGRVQPPNSVISRSICHAYFRFSAFARDKRVNVANGGFLPGTYATTYNDIHHVPSGFAAVGRYALPNPASARYVHQLVTAMTPSLVGTAAPNFGQAGGGVEVLFKNAAGPAIGSSFLIAAG